MSYKEQQPLAHGGNNQADDGEAEGGRNGAQQVRGGNSSGAGFARFEWQRHRLFDRLAATSLFERCRLAPAPSATVVQVRDRERRVHDCES